MHLNQKFRKLEAFKIKIKKTHIYLLVQEVILGFLILAGNQVFSQELTQANSIHQFKVLDIDGKRLDFSCYEGQKILIVNTASKCMYAPQLRKLQELYEKYKDLGFIVIAFPSSDFYNRELKTNRQIAEKYRTKYHITFPIISKVHVKGDSIHAVFDFLSDKNLNGKFDASPKWNFHKYLFDAQGFLFKSIPPSNSPLSEEIINWIEKN